MLNPPRAVEGGAPSCEGPEAKGRHHEGTRRTTWLRYRRSVKPKRRTGQLVTILVCSGTHASTAPVLCPNSPALPPSQNLTHPHPFPHSLDSLTLLAGPPAAHSLRPCARWSSLASMQHALVRNASSRQLGIRHGRPRPLSSHARPYTTLVCFDDDSRTPRLPSRALQTNQSPGYSHCCCCCCCLLAPSLISDAYQILLGHRPKVSSALPLPDWPATFGVCCFRRSLPQHILGMPSPRSISFFWDVSPSRPFVYSQ